MSTDPLAAYHDRLNAVVLEALTTIQTQVQGLRTDMQDLSTRLATSQRVASENAQRLIELETRTNKDAGEHDRRIEMLEVRGAHTPPWVPVVGTVSQFALALAAWGGFVLALVRILGGPA